MAIKPTKHSVVFKYRDKKFCIHMLAIGTVAVGRAVDDGCLEPADRGSQTRSTEYIELIKSKTSFQVALQDVILVRPNCSFPKGTGNGKSPNFAIGLSDSASSVHANASSALQDTLPLEERKSSRTSLSKVQRSSKSSLKGLTTYGLFCVFDGHNGAAAAQHLEEHLAITLEEKLPPGSPPDEGSEPAFTVWREELQRALVETFCDLCEDFACKGKLAGTTVTVVLQYGSLLTIANCGDSRALLDTGSDHMLLTVDHRIATNQDDRHRLEAMGAQIAPIDGSGSGPAINKSGYGPLRVWPGGLCLSRGIGDFDIGPCVVSCPNIHQVRVPETGGRLILATDGLWDAFENTKRLCRMSRNWPCQVAPNKLIQAIQRAYGGLRDDTSVVVLDIMPAGQQFTELGAKKNRPQRSSSGSCFCFSPSQTDLSEADQTQKPVRAEVLAQLDVAAAAGLMPEKLNPATLPAWCSPELLEAVAGSQVAACNAWNEARSMRSRGKEPSRVDLASFFTAVHHVRPLPDTKHADPHDMDISTRPDLFGKRQTVDDVTVRPRKEASGTLADAAALASAPASKAGEEGEQSASTRFSEHVAQPSNFARKFGHYKQHMSDPHTSEEGSSTGDDSQRVQSSVDEDSSFQRERDWQEHLGESGRRHSSDSSPSSRPRHLQTSIDSSVGGSSVALPTVVEEVPGSKKSIVGSLPKQEDEETMGEPPAEMAVRRGKNRFMTGEV